MFINSKEGMIMVRRPLLGVVTILVTSQGLTNSVTIEAINILRLDWPHLYNLIAELWDYANSCALGRSALDPS